MTGMHSNENNYLIGAWKLEHFESLTEGMIFDYNDILIFSNKYYSDFQAERGESDFVNSHVGRYTVRGDTIAFQIQLSNIKESIGRVASGTFTINGDTLQIKFIISNMPGIWTYKRLE